jgi:hypothetical protein
MSDATALQTVEYEQPISAAVASSVLQFLSAWSTA